MLKPRTARKIITAGAIASQGALSRVLEADLHHGAPGRGRRLCAESDEADRGFGDDGEADAKRRLHYTAFNTLGSTWRNTMIGGRTPTERAAST